MARGLLIKHGDILQSGATVICHQVNCKGVMGAGLAKQIRDKYPMVYQEYRVMCQNKGDGLLGTALLSTTDNTRYLSKEQQRFIANCFGQLGYGRGVMQTDYAALEHALYKVRRAQQWLHYDTIAFPFGMGCGLAGGDWSIVSSIIESIFRPLDVELTYWKL